MTVSADRRWCPPPGDYLDGQDPPEAEASGMAVSLERDSGRYVERSWSEPPSRGGNVLDRQLDPVARLDRMNSPKGVSLTRDARST